MSIKHLKQWLSRRRESRILKRIREHLIKINSCVSKSSDFYDFWVKKDVEATKSSYKIISEEERTADVILANIVDMLSEGETPEYVRADLLNFVRLADKAAGAVKRGTQNLLILIEASFPEKITEIIGTIIESLVEESKLFIKTFDKMFQIEREQLLEIINEVDKLESEIDKQYHNLKYEMAYNTPETPAGALIILDHAIRDLEEASDLIEDVAGLIRSIVLL